MRLDNLRERKALLKKLDIAQDKKVLKVSNLLNRKHLPVDYGSRPKSTRIKKKMDKICNNERNVSSKHVFPSWMGHWRSSKHNSSIPVPRVELNIKEVISEENNYHKSTRFLDSVKEEVQENVPEVDVHTEQSNCISFEKLTEVTLSKSKINSIDTCGEFVCYGDSDGSVGIYLDGRTTSLLVHSESVTNTVFVDSSGKSILSSSVDGSVRLTDLVAQSSTIAYESKNRIEWIEQVNSQNFLVNCEGEMVKRLDIRKGKGESVLTFTKKNSFGDYNNSMSIHPLNHNLMSICQNSVAAIYDLRNPKQTVHTFQTDRGCSGASWSPRSGKYFQTSEIGQGVEKHYSFAERVSFYDASTNFNQILLKWPQDRSIYSYTLNTGATWCPWNENIFFTTAVYNHRKHKINSPSHQIVVGIDATSGRVASEIKDGIANNQYLIKCHSYRNWMILANASGSG